MAQADDSTEAAFLLERWKQNVCPYCGRAIPSGTRVGIGKVADGGFCSLKCYSKYYEPELIERHRRISADRAANDSRDSDD